MEKVMENIDGAVALQSYINSIVDFTPEEMETVMECFKPMHLPAGEYFADEGIVCKHIGFVTRGYIRAYYEIHDVEVTTMVLGKHHIVTSHTSFSLQRPSMMYIQAISDCDMLVLDYESMMELYKKVPKWERLGRLIMEQIYGYMEGRVLDYLSLGSEDRYRKLLKNDPKLFKNVPLRYVASMLGITPETLSRIRNKVHKGES